MPVFNNALAGAAGQSGGADAYTIERSLRFNPGDTPKLSRTGDPGGNRKTWTFSCWFKRTGTPSRDQIISAPTPGRSNAYIEFQNDKLMFEEYGGGQAYIKVETNRVFRDPSAWYHAVIAVDTTQSTPADRVKIYINGVKEESFATATYPSPNYETSINNATEHKFSQFPGNANFPFDGYLAECYMVDGKQLAPTEFGEFDVTTGVWNPIEYTGGYDVTGGTTVAAASGAEPILNTSDNYGSTISSGVRADSNSSNIVLALPLNGSNNGTTITDYHHTIKGSGSAKTVSIYNGSTSGGAVTSTAQSVFYGSSFYTVRGPTNNYTASDYIYRTGDSDLAFGTGSFCVEFWYRPGTFVQNSTMFDSRHNSTDWPNATHGFQFYTNHNGDLILRTGSSNVIHVGQGQLEEGKWHHLAVTGDLSGGNRTIRVFRDGVQRGTVVNNNDFSEGRFHLGSAANNGEGSNGYYADLRIYKGVAKYTSNFTVPDKPPGGVNQFHLKFADNSSDAALGTDSSGSNNNWTVTNLTAAAASADTRQTWSQSQSGYHSSNAASAFDGNLSTSAFASSGANANAYVDISPINASKVEVYISAYTSTSAGGYYYCRQTDNTQHTYTISSSGTSLGWVTVYDGSQISINRLGGARNSSGSAGSAQYAWRVDGVLLVNNGTTGFNPTAIDSFVDSPTNYQASSGNNGGNYPTWNPLDNGGSLVLSNGNLEAADTNNNQHRACRATQRIPNSGKWYFECTITAFSNTIGFGISTSTAADPELATSGSRYLLINTGGNVQRYDGSAWTEFSGQSGLGSGIGSGSVMQVAVDQDAGKLWFGVNNVWLGTTTSAAGNPSNGTNPTITGTFTDAFPVINCVNVGGAVNFGQREFKYTPPTDFKSLCTQNLDDPLIAKGSKYFDVKTYDGNAGTKSISLDFGPDLLWLKSRSASKLHALCDSVRGDGKLIYSDSTLGEQDIGASVVDLTSSGFNLGYNSNYTQVSHNHNTESLIAWAWDAGDSNTSISVGGLNSSVYNTSQSSWQSFLTTTNGNGFPDSNYPVTWAFDGHLNHHTYTGDDDIYFTPSGGVSFDITSQVRIRSFLDATVTVETNTGTYGPITSGNSGSWQWTTVPCSGTLTKITIRRVGGANLSGIEIDGVLLINSGATPPNIPAIASTVRANQTAGCSIVSFTGNSTAGSTIGHGLNAQPSFILLKNRDRAINWAVGHLAANTFVDGDLNINTTNSKGTGYIGFFGANPTSNVFTVNNNYESNYASEDYIAYCFAPVEGYSAFTSHTVSSGTNFVYLGFRPRFLMLKRTGDGSTTNMGFASWAMFDTERDTFNEVDFDTILYANVNHSQGKRGDGNATTGGTYLNIDILSNGIRFQSGAAEFSQPSDEIIVMAWAENPFKYARAR